MELNDLIEKNIEKVDLESIDAEMILQDTEEISELERETENAFSNVFGLNGMIEEYGTIIENVDTESITENQLTALRVGIVGGFQAANADSKRLVGIDVENEIIVPSSSLMYDMEGLKEFAKKAWEKFKTLLIKANAFFRKLFLKFLNMVSFRKGTIEKLEEDLAATTVLNTKLDKLASKASFINVVNGKTGKEANLGSYKNLLNAGINVNIAKDLNAAVKSLADRVKTIEAYVKDGGTLDAKLVAGKSFFNKVSSGVKNMSTFPIPDVTKYETVLLGGLFGNKGSAIGIKKNGEAVKASIKVTSPCKTITGVTTANLESLLKEAATVNDDFKSIVNDTFEVVDDVMGISEDMSDIVTKGASLTDEKKKQFSTDKKAVRNMISLLPWMAFNSALSLYKEVGFVIALTKASIKETK